MDAGDMALFRGEAVEARGNRVQGEIVLAQPLGTHVIVSLIFGSVVAIALWLTLGTYTRTETAHGILSTDIPSAKIIAIRPGQVTALLVREGDFVRAGQRIAEIHTEQSDEGGDSAIGEGLTAIDSQRALGRERESLVGRRARSEQARLRAMLEGLARQRSDLETQIALQQQTAVSARELFERLQSLRESGFISRVELEQRRQAYLATQQELARLHQQLNSLQSDVGQAVAQLSRTDADADSEVVTVRATTESLTQQRAQLRGERAYIITAPISGRVAALQTGIGRTAQANVPLMEIIPEGSRLHAEIYAPTRAIGFVRVGQEVRLLYDAFPYQRFGSFAGRIVSVSRTVIDPHQLAVPLDIQEPVYRIDVAPDAQTVDAFRQSMPLQPGMTLTGDIILDRRSFLDWLLEPINAVMRRHG
jgi:membrane fusion protein